MDSLTGKVVIITGASEGIGARLATLLARRGVRLALAARNEARLRDAGGPAALVVPGDLTDASVRAGLIAKTLERWGQIDVLINNAGRGSYYTASTAPIDEARDLFELNFFAPLALAQLAAPHLRRTRGSIVNVSSIAGQISLPWLPVYSASKFALASITSTLRIELERDGVHVMGVFPGYVDTEFQAHAPGPRPPASVVKGKRYAVSPEQCAAAILHGMERRKRTVVTPRAGWLLVWANRLFPRLVEMSLQSRDREGAVGLA
jgi:short-subunit dehydrogenase